MKISLHQCVLYKHADNGIKPGPSLIQHCGRYNEEEKIPSSYRIS